MVGENDPKTDDDGGTNDPPKSDPDYVTKDEIKGMFDGFKDEIKGLLGKPEGTNKPDPEDDKGKKDEEAHLSRIAAAEERARKMIEEAAEKVLASKPKEPEKKEEKQEQEKPPIKPRKLTTLLWGSE